MRIIILKIGYTSPEVVGAGLVPARYLAQYSFLPIKSVDPDK